MDRRVLLTAGLCFAILFVWQNYVLPPPPKKPMPQAASAPAALTPMAAEKAASQPALAPLTLPSAPEKTVALDTALFTAEISSKGGGLRQVTLKEFKEGGQRRGEEKYPVELVGQSPQPIAAAVLEID